MRLRIFRRYVLVAVAIVALAGGAVATRGLTHTVRAAPEADPTYANGITVYMIGAHVMTDPEPNLLASAPPLYVLAYPVNPTGTRTDPVTLPSGFQPQCNPCYHPGAPLKIAYHDHVLPGAPGFGANGTALDYKGPWRIVILVYNPRVIFSPTFHPVMSDEELDKAEAAGEFLPIASGASNPYELELNQILICPVVSSHA